MRIDDLHAQQRLDVAPLLMVKLNRRSRDETVKLIRGLQGVYADVDARTAILDVIAKDVTKRSFHGRRIRPGFTLVELLVTVLVVILLTGMMLPVIKVALSQARRIQCVNAIRPTAIAAIAYGGDWDGIFFGNTAAGAFAGGLVAGGYIEKVADMRDPTWKPDPLSSYVRTYALECSGPSGYACTQMNSPGVNLNKAGPSGQQILFVDSIGTMPIYITFQQQSYYVRGAQLGGADGAYHFRHRQRTNAVFLDGHTESMTIARIKDLLLSIPNPPNTPVATKIVDENGNIIIIPLP